MPVPPHPKIYHIVHVNRLASIVADGWLWCDATMVRRPASGTTIGMSTIKQTRLNELRLTSHPALHVGDCVPFYFCPRSVMLYLVHRANHPELTYRGGQGPILHLEADLRATVAWANKQAVRWAFTLSNAGSRFFEDRCDLAQLNEVEWDAVAATNWQSCKDGKQAEFLVHGFFPWELVEMIGVASRNVESKVGEILVEASHKPTVSFERAWYF